MSMTNFYMSFMALAPYDNGGVGIPPKSLARKFKAKLNFDIVDCIGAQTFDSLPQLVLAVQQLESLIQQENEMYGKSSSKKANKRNQGQ